MKETQAIKLLDYYNQSRNARCKDYEPFLKALDKYNHDEIKLDIDWFESAGKGKAKPKNICRMTNFDGYLSDSLRWKELQQTYQQIHHEVRKSYPFPINKVNVGQWIL